jgi:acyl carrier protein
MGDVQQVRDSESLKDEIRQIVSTIARIDPGELQEHVLIREELGIDSLMSMEIIARCEKLLEIKIDESRFFDVQTVGDFFDLLIALTARGHG